MSEPEIARRCTACGVTVRQRAVFCPQCGNPVSQDAATTTTAPAETIIEPAPAPVPVQRTARHPDGVKGRVKKLKHVSSVMIDQAAYDPSLRFILVAAAMFLLFLVLLILSKVLG